MKRLKNRRRTRPISFLQSGKTRIRISAIAINGSIDLDPPLRVIRLFPQKMLALLTILKEGRDIGRKILRHHRFATECKEQGCR